MMSLLTLSSRRGRVADRAEPGRDVTAVVSVIRGVARPTWRPDRFRQRVTLRNLSRVALPGAVVLVLQGLAKGTRLRGTGCPDSVRLPAGLGPGACVTVDLEFDSPSERIGGRARVVAG